MQKKVRLEFLYPTLDRSELKKLNRERQLTFDQLPLLSEERKILQSILIVSSELWDCSKVYDKDWTRENIEKGARILATQPGFIPIYIANTARIIVNELLGVGHCDDIYTFDNSKTYYMKGKMHLSIFLSVIEQLEKNDVNLAELPVNYSQFIYLDTNNVYENLSNDYETGNAIDLYVSSNYCDDLYPLMKKYCYYKNLYDFLNNIKEIVSRVEPCAHMPDPETLNFCENKYFVDNIYNIYLKNRDFESQATKNRSQLPKGNMISVIAYIDKVLEKLKLGEKLAEKKVAINYIKEIMAQIKISKSNEKDDLVKKLKEILANIPLNEEKKREWESVLGKEELEEILNYVNKNSEVDENNNLQEELKKAKKEPEEILNYVNKNSEVDENNNLQEELKKAKKELEDKTRELEELRGIIFDYLNYGGKKPKFFDNSISNDEIKEILKTYHSKKKASMIRKWFLIVALSVSVIANIVMLTKNHNSHSNTITIEEENSSDLNGDSDDLFPSNDNKDMQNSPDSTPKEDNENSSNLNEDSDDLFPSNDNKDMQNNPDSAPKDDNENIQNNPDSMPEEDILVPNIKKIKEEIYLGKEIELTEEYIYRSIYDEKPIDTRTEKGFIIAYFPYILTENGKNYFPSLRSQEEVMQFIEQHIDYIEEISWKVAFTKDYYGNTIKSLLENNQAIDYRYTSYFIDYVPNFEKEKVNIKR